MSKITEDEGIKKVRMLLPTKTQNGIIERRLMEEFDDKNNENRSNEEHDAQDSNIEEETDLCVSFNSILCNIMND